MDMKNEVKKSLQKQSNQTPTSQPTSTPSPQTTPSPSISAYVSNLELGSE